MKSKELLKKQKEYEKIVYDIQELYFKYSNKDISKEKYNLILEKMRLLDSKKNYLLNEIILLNEIKERNNIKLNIIVSYIIAFILTIILLPINLTISIAFMSLTYLIAKQSIELKKVKNDTINNLLMNKNRQTSFIPELFKTEMNRRITNELAQEYLTKYLDNDLDIKLNNNEEDIRNIISNDYNISNENLKDLLQEYKNNIIKEKEQIKKLELTLED